MNPRGLLGTGKTSGHLLLHIHFCNRNYKVINERRSNIKIYYIKVNFTGDVEWKYNLKKEKFSNVKQELFMYFLK